MRYAFGLTMCLAGAAMAASAPIIDEDTLQTLQNADIVLAGEHHDNPDHHANQTVIAREIAPSAIVFEMLSAKQAARVTPDVRLNQPDLEAVLDWGASGWPDFGMYFPIFSAAPEAVIYGAAIPREQARAAMTEGVVARFVGDALAYGLDVPLTTEEQTQRETFQADAHCNALPTEMLPTMVEIQRLRDAELARVSAQALDETGGPVLVITGNGHARIDWGIPVYLKRARPDLRVVALGQGERGHPPAGRFDMVWDAPAPERDDPCAAFE